MSGAFVVTATHVDLLVRVAIAGHADADPTQRRTRFPLRWTTAAGERQYVARAGDDGASIAGTPVSPTEVGRVLVLQNEASAARALGTTSGADEPYAYRDYGYTLTAAETSAAVGCLEHQCVADPSWPASDARAILDALAVAVFGSLAGRAEAPWAWTAADLVARAPATREGPGQ